MTDEEQMALMEALVGQGWSAEDAEEVAEAVYRAEQGQTDESGRWLALALTDLVAAL